MAWYEEGTTREAMFRKDIDKFEMLFQAYEYEMVIEIILPSTPS